MMEVQLPGGLLQDGCIQRNARFRPLTGRIEQSLIESAASLDRPAYVTSVLSQVLDAIGESAIDADMVSRLSVADRQYLMLRLAALLNGEQMWLKVDCGHCDAPFDVELLRCDLPVKQAGDSFPEVSLHLENWDIEARVPTGQDQEAIPQSTEEEALRTLLQKCICSVNGGSPHAEFSQLLNEEEIEAIDEALDEVAPAVCDRLLVTCPECNTEQNALLDHYANIGLNEYFFYDEIHTLASHYHWSEADILDLPRSKRRRYLQLINRSSRSGAAG
jgi:hypothetical protein